ncbi:MAG: 2-hydroxyacid dehydrogenase [Acidiferrobacterales bacterium]
MQGVFLDSGSLDREDIDFEALRGTLPDWKFHAQTLPAETVDRIKHSHIVVSNKVVLDRATMQSAPDLKLVCVAATGTNNVDLAAAKELGIIVCNVVHYAAPSVVQHVFALITALNTRLLNYHEAVQNGQWNQSNQFCLLDFPIRELEGLVLGIVGFGELGKAVARAAECFGMRVLVSQRPGSNTTSGTNPDRIPLADLLPQVDILSLHCPLTDATRNLIGTEELGMMKDTALLINTARGGIVDEQALADALAAGSIGGAGIDTLTEEPPVNGNALLDPGLPNLIVTPHIAWGSRSARQRLVDGVAANIQAFLENEPINRVA